MLRFPTFFYFLMLSFLIGCQGNHSSIPAGVFWSSQLQEYLVIQDQQFKSYQWTSFSCIPTVSGLIPQTGPVKSHLGQLRFGTVSKDTLGFRRISDGLPIFFTRAMELPKNCNIQTVPTAMTQFIVLHKTIEAFGHKLPNDVVLQNQGQVAAIDQVIDDTEYSEILLFTILTETLSALNDGHAFLYSRNLDKFWSSFTSPTSVKLSGIEFCNGAIIFSAKENAVWLHIQRLISFDNDGVYQESARECLRQISKQLQTIEQPALMQLHIDLRNNSGGSLVYAAEILALLTHSSALLSTVDDQPIRSATTFEKLPVFKSLNVWINSSTASAAEHLALALKLNGYTVMGEKSAGSFSPGVVKTLPNGWFFGFSMYKNIKDSRGQPVPEKEGIEIDCLPIQSTTPIKCHPNH